MISQDIINLLKGKYLVSSDMKTEFGQNLHYEEFYGLYLSPNIVRVIKYRGLKCPSNIARVGDSTSAFEILADKSIARGSLGRLKIRWNHDMKINLSEIRVVENVRSG